MSDGRARLQPCRKLSLLSVEEPAFVCSPTNQCGDGRPRPSRPSASSARQVAPPSRISKRLLQSARLKAVPFQMRSCMSRLFPPFEKREGWGTLGCGASVEFKGVGQECPTHTSVSDPHRNVRPTQERPISRHVGFLFVLGGWAGSSWFSKIVPGFAVDFVARHASLAGREDFHAGDGAE
jgi:hypothetical protein